MSQVYYLKMECNYCNKIIKTQYNLDKHIKGVHLIDEDDAKYCTVCGHLKSFDEYYKTKYNTYMSRCKKCNKDYVKEQIPCDICGKIVCRKNMYKHKKSKNCSPRYSL